MQCVLATRAGAILDFLQGLRGTLHLTFEEGTHSAWLYDLLVRRVARVLVCNPRKNALLKSGNKSDRIDARKLAELLRGGLLRPVYHGENEHDDGAASGAQLYHADRRHDAGERTAEGGLSRPGHRQRGQEGVWRSGIAGSGWRSWEKRVCGGVPSCSIRNWMPCSAAPRGQRELIAECRKHEAAKQLRTVPFLGPIRAAVLLGRVQTPHRFRTKRQFWAYCGLALETRSSGEYRMVDGQWSAAKKPALIRGLNWNHNHELKNLFKSRGHHGQRARGSVSQLLRRTAGERPAAGDGAADAWRAKSPPSR